MPGARSDKALATISQDGVLLVLASMIDNMPYVLAEASVMRIPLLIYDVGGVTEMIDPKLHADIICGTPKVRAPVAAAPCPLPELGFCLEGKLVLCFLAVCASFLSHEASPGQFALPARSQAAAHARSAEQHGELNPLSML